MPRTEIAGLFCRLPSASRISAGVSSPVAMELISLGENTLIGILWSMQAYGSLEIMALLLDYAAAQDGHPRGVSSKALI